MASRPRLAQLDPSNATNGQLARYNSTSGEWEPYSIPPYKSGRVLVGSFTGNPKKATVTFGTAFADTDYSAVATAVTTNNRVYTCAVESPLAGSFVINLGSNLTTDLAYVSWHATKAGEAP